MELIFLILFPSLVFQVITSPISSELHKDRKTIVRKNKRDVSTSGEKGRVGRRLYSGWSQRTSFDSLSSLVPTSDHETLDKESATKEAFLDIIDDISRGIRCLNYHYKDVLDGGDSRHVFLPKELDSIQDTASLDRKLKYSATANRISLLSSILSQYQPQTDSFKLLRSALDHLVRLDDNLFRVRIAWLNERSVVESGRNGHLLADYFVHIERKKRLSTESYNRSLPLSSPWLQLPKKGRKNQYIDRILKEGSVQINVNTFSRDELTFSDWSPIYFSCDLKKWLVSYTSLIISDSEQLPGNNLYTLKGFVSVDIDITNTDFNQCDESDVNSEVTAAITNAFPVHNTHKCDRTSSQCIFRSGWGWKRGGYTCKCRDGYYSSSSVDEDHSKHSFNGSLVESAWKLKNQRKGLAYDMIYTCKKCAEDCESCVDGSSCLSSSNWSFRVSLFFISILVITLILVLIYYIYPY